ncbi:MAG TPA: hypothetical protein VEI02_14160 [Planctomycetota bacterium]|nr:hypothetical protein [Planctomycetota bacterium]
MAASSPRLTVPLAAAAVACALWATAARPVLDVGFLADDYEVGALTVAQAEKHPRLLDRIRASFVERFSERFDVFRPLTLLTVADDYRRYGADGGRHHVTNAALWFLAAVAAGGVAAQLARRGRAPDDPPGLGGPVLAFAASLGAFAAVETLGWLVAREDLLVALFGLTAWWAQLRAPRSIVAPLPWLALAFLSKDTAVVLPPALTWARLWTPGPRDGDAVGAGDAEPPPFERRARRFFRWTGPWLVLAAYFAARVAVYGHIGSKYLDRSYGEWLADGRAPEHLAASLGRLAAPWNDAWSLRNGVPLAARWAAPALWGVVALIALGARRRGDARLVLAALPFLVAAPALTAPLYEVADTLQQGRTLALPATALAALLGLWFDRAASSRRRGARRTATTAATLAVAWSLLALWFHLGPYVAATATARGVLESLAAAPDGARVTLSGAEQRTPPFADLEPSLTSTDGAYVLSGGLPFAVRPPFRTPGLASLDMGPAVRRDPATGRWTLAPGAGNAWFAALPRESDGGLPRAPDALRFTLARAPGAGGVPVRDDVGATLDVAASNGAPGLAAAFAPPADLRDADVLEFTLVTPRGRVLVERVAAVDAEAGTALAAGAPAAADALEGPTWLAWSVEVRRAGVAVARTPWRVLAP